MSRRIERTAQRLSIKYKTNYDLILELLDIVGKKEAVDILEMTPKDLNHTARVNLLKTSRKDVINELKTEGIIAKPNSEIPEAITITKGEKKLGFSNSYLKGKVMPQGYGSILTVDILDPKPGDKVLDMAAAPGGKSCFIGERLQGEGHLIVNDISSTRYRSLIFNLTRHGIENVSFSNKDAKKIQIQELDKILLDAPCTGGGLLVSKPHRRTSKDLTDSMQLQRLQIQLLQHALSLLTSEGICVYSTCAISPLENELVVDRFKNKVEFVPLDVTGIDAKLQDEIIGKRLYPHLHGCDGFFIVKMVKK